MGDAGSLVNSQNTEIKTDVLLQFWHIRPVIEDGLSALHGRIEGRFVVGGVCSKKIGCRLWVPVLPGAAVAFQPFLKFVGFDMHNSLSNVIPQVHPVAIQQFIDLFGAATHQGLSMSKEYDFDL